MAPFILNYSGSLFREYPGPWQVMLKQDNGELACIAERPERYTLTEVFLFLLSPSHSRFVACAVPLRIPFWR